MQAQQSLRTVFRKLASALHPDRASDAADAERRTALMQRANAAYAADDLLALLTLQLEIEQIDAAHLRGASEAQLKHFNAVLQEQFDELQSEIALKERAFCAEFSLRPRQTLHPAKLAPTLANAVADMKRRGLRRQARPGLRDHARRHPALAQEAQGRNARHLRLKRAEATEAA